MDIKFEELKKELVKKYHTSRFNDSKLEKLYKLSTTEISDALGGNNVMESQIKPISPNMKIVGRAFTVQLPFQDSNITHNAIEEAESGDILIINTNKSCEKAVWGDVKTIKAMKKGIGGIVVDGAIRDASGNIDLGFPVFTKYVVPAASNHNGGGELNIPIVCGGVKVNPGDIVVGDENGVVVIDKDKLNEVIEVAILKQKLDQDKILKILISDENKKTK